MISSKVGATASLVMFLIVCIGCINKDLVEARKIQVIKQSDEPVYHTDSREAPPVYHTDSHEAPPVYHDGPKAFPPSINTPEDMDESVYHTDYHRPCPNRGCTPNSLHHNLEDMDEDLVEARKIAAPPSINNPEDMDESVYHTDYHGPCHNRGCYPRPNYLEDMDESVIHTDYHGVSTHPPGPPHSPKT